MTQRCLGENSATSFPVPLGSPAWRSALQGPGTCPGSVGTGLPGPLQRSASSLSTCSRLQWVSASETAYFPTVFKTEATVTAQTREADEDQHFFIWCFILSQTCACPPAWWETGLALRPPCPGVGLGELRSLLWGHAGRAVLSELKPGPQGAGLLGGGWFGCGGWMAVEPPETLTFAVTWATLGRSPDLSPGASSLVVCPPGWGLGGVSSHPDQPQGHRAFSPQEWAPR